MSISAKKQRVKVAEKLSDLLVRYTDLRTYKHIKHRACHFDDILGISVSVLAHFCFEN